MTAAISSSPPRSLKVHPWRFLGRGQPATASCRLVVSRRVVPSVTVTVPTLLTAVNVYAVTTDTGSPARFASVTVTSRPRAS